ncbi:MAG TPA: phytoene dehydrogenase, partial [Pirellulales bacterium]|nr:phytoene dehydrogenase [Pirellulales bacterium]
WDEFELREQFGSRIAFPGANLRFSNDPQLLPAEVSSQFPDQIAGLRRLIAELPDYDQLDLRAPRTSARAYLRRFLTEPLLVEMLLCPLMYYGNARETDMDVAQFCIMFRSIFLEGFARPRAGVRLILKKLVRRYKQLGGLLRLRAGVARLKTAGPNVVGVVLDDGQELSAKQILSSAGAVETARLCSAAAPAPVAGGILSFVETISILDRPPASYGHAETIVFFNDAANFDWRRPAELVDVRSGVICSPNNFAYDAPLAEGIVRVTALANFERWQALSPERYQDAKQAWFAAVQQSAARFVPDCAPFTVATDMFTPTTIRRFTGHDQGAVYGAPEKRYDGTTPFQNLFLCGTDQGYVGIVGALVSGIAMANVHCLPR